MKHPKESTNKETNAEIVTLVGQGEEHPEVPISQDCEHIVVENHGFEDIECEHPVFICVQCGRRCNNADFIDE